jgi:hypothetical protein
MLGCWDDECGDGGCRDTEIAGRRRGRRSLQSNLQIAVPAFFVSMFPNVCDSSKFSLKLGLQNLGTWEQYFINANIGTSEQVIIDTRIEVMINAPM